MPDGTAAGDPRRVLVTRPAGRGDELARRLAARGAIVDLRPTIAFAPPADLSPRDRALARLDRVDWIVVTSPTAVSFLFDAMHASGRTAPARARFAAVGPGTARALSDHGVAAALVARRNDADGLAKELASEVAAGELVLVVRPESSAREVVIDLVRAHGAEVIAAPFYRTVPAPDCGAIARDVVAGAYDVVVFSSPSTFLRLAEAAGDDRPRLIAALVAAKVVAIGAVTEAALAGHGIPPDAVAPAPTDPGIETAVVSVW